MMLDEHIHEPARLLIMTILSGVGSADFVMLLTTTALTRGNLSSHIARLERIGYVDVLKGFLGKIPHTEYRLTPAGRDALAQYWVQLDEIRARYRSSPPE